MFLCYIDFWRNTEFTLPPKKKSSIQGFSFVGLFVCFSSMRCFTRHSKETKEKEIRFCCDAEKL